MSGRFIIVFELVFDGDLCCTLFFQRDSNDLAPVIRRWNMIPSILGPDINIICEKSMAELQCVEPDGQELGHLDPNGGFMVLMSCTEEVVLRLASTICFISQDIEQSNF